MVVQTCRAFFSSLSSQVNIKLIDYYIRYFKTTEVASTKSCLEESKESNFTMKDKRVDSEHSVNDMSMPLIGTVES